MKVTVLGAGVVGVSTAWFLAQSGHEVEVIERSSGPARETSFANGGQISVSQSAPWAEPGAPWQILKWLARPDSPLLFRPRLDLAQWSWILGFLLQCRPRRFRHNLRQMVTLGSYSRATFAQLRAELGVEYQHLARGIVTLIETPREMDEAAAACALFQAHGIDKRVIGARELLTLEPALAPIAPRLAGATWCPDDESGDVHQFTCQLAERAARAGVVFHYNTRVNALECDADRVLGVSVSRPEGHYDTARADAYVLALGSFSAQIARGAGLRLPIYPSKGYSATVPIMRPELAPQVSITDEARKIVISRLGDQLRIAGTAELAGYSHALNPLRCAALIQRAQCLFAADSCAWDSARFWSGLRPATPGNVPLIGRSSRHRNLFLNTGHGTLGFTEGPGSGRALAEIISGRPAPIDFEFLGS